MKWRHGSEGLISPRLQVPAQHGWKGNCSYFLYLASAHPPKFTYVVSTEERMIVFCFWPWWSSKDQINPFILNNEKTRQNKWPIILWHWTAGITGPLSHRRATKRIACCPEVYRPRHSTVCNVQSTLVWPSWGDRDQSLGKPRKLEFMGQGARGRKGREKRERGWGRREGGRERESKRQGEREYSEYLLELKGSPWALSWTLTHTALRGK